MIKKLVLILAIMSLAIPCQAFDFVVQGINLRWFQERAPLELLAGVAVGIAVHELAHFGAAYVQGHHAQMTWKDGGPYILFSGDASHEYLWEARAGFGVEIAIGLVLTLLPRTSGSDFTLGYTAGTAARLGIYRLHFDRGDFKTIEEGGGSSELEWFIAGGISSMVLIKAVHDTP